MHTKAEIKKILDSKLGTGNKKLTDYILSFVPSHPVEDGLYYVKQNGIVYIVQIKTHTTEGLMIRKIYNYTSNKALTCVWNMTPPYDDATWLGSLPAPEEEQVEDGGPERLIDCINRRLIATEGQATIKSVNVIITDVKLIDSNNIEFIGHYPYSDDKYTYIYDINSIEDELDISRHT